MKKVITLLLIICLVVSGNVYAMNVRNYTGNKVAFDIALTLIEAICMEVFDTSAKTVNRGDFITLAVMLRTNGVYGSINSEFSDVKADTQLSHCLSYAVGAGLISKGELFNPDAALTSAAAIKIAVAALGYNVHAELAGGYPFGYFSVANRIGLLDNVGSCSEEYITAEDAFILLFNMINTKLYKQVEFGNVIRYDTDGATILSMIYDIAMITDVVKANMHTSLTDPSGKLPLNIIRIGTIDAIYNGDENYLGYNVRAYIKDLDGTAEVVALFPYRTEIVTFTCREFDGIEGNIVKLYADGKMHKYRLNKSVFCIYNGKAAEIANVSDLITTNETKVTLIDNDLDSVYNVMLIDSYQYCYVGSVNAAGQYILDANGKDSFIDLSSKDCFYTISGTYEDKKITEIDDISVGMLLAFTVSEDNKLVNITVCDGYVSGTIVAYNISDRILETENGEYEFGNYFARYYSNMKVNTPTAILLGINGEAVVMQSSVGGFMYGWVVKAFRSSQIALPQFKIFTQHGKMHIYSVDNNVIFNGSKMTASEFYNAVCNFAFDGRFIKYFATESGVIKKVNTPIIADPVMPFIPEEEGKDDKLYLCYSGIYQYKSAVNSFLDKFTINNSYVFVIPAAEEDRDDDTNYLVTDSAYFSNDQKPYVQAYDCDTVCDAGAVVTFASYSDDNMEGLTHSAVVQKVYRSLDNDNNECYQISLYNNGSYIYLYSNSNSEKKVAALKPGDLIRYKEHNGKISAVRLEYSYETDKLINTYTSGSNVDFVKGTVYDLKNSFISIMSNVRNVTMPIHTNSILSCSIPSSVAYVHIKLNDDGSVRKAEVRPTAEQNIQGYIKAGDKASYIVVQRNYYKPIRMFVYIID